MALLSRLSQRRGLRRATRGAFEANLPSLRAIVAQLPPPREFDDSPPLDGVHLADLWPDTLGPAILGWRNADPEIVEELEDEFHWIADVAGRKLHQLARTGSSSGPHHETERAHIIDEARVFASVAAQCAVRRLSYPKGAAAVQYPDHARLLPGAGAINDDDDTSTEERLQRLLTFVVGQEPRIGWSIGKLDDGSTVITTDLAHGWIPPRIALPAGVDVLPPAHQARATMRELLASANASGVVEYVPGVAFPAIATPWSPTTSSWAVRCSSPRDGLHAAIVESTARRGHLAPMIRALVREAARQSDAAWPHALFMVRKNLEDVRHQLLSDYPVTTAMLAGDCMLLAAVEGWLCGDEVNAAYHFGWFEAFDLGR